MSSRKVPWTKNLRRSQGTKDSPPAILVACEGKTEKDCLDRLSSRWRIPRVEVEVLGERGVPKTVVQKAKLRGQQHGRKKKDQPETWVVFDRDEHDSWFSAIDQANALGLKLAISNPCFELWAILLHRNQTAEIERRPAQSRLKRLHPGYDHYRKPVLDCDTVLERDEKLDRDRIDVAHERAENLIRIAKRDHQDPFKNPTTYFHLLVERLRAIAPK